MDLPHSFPLRNLARTLLAGAALSLFSCASAQLDFMDPAHAATGFRTGPVAIAGVVQTDSKCLLSDWDRNAVPNEIGRLLAKKRRGISVIPWERFKETAGKPRAQVSSNGNLLSNAFSSSQLARAQKLGAAYLLLVEISENRTWSDVDESCHTDTDEIRDCEGHVISCITTTTFTTSSQSHRRARARYFLFDVNTGKKVWVTSSTHRKIHTNSACSSCCFPPPPWFPEPPSVADVMKNMSAAAIRKLPRG